MNSWLPVKRVNSAIIKYSPTWCEDQSRIHIVIAVSEQVDYWMDLRRDQGNTARADHVGVGA